MKDSVNMITVAALNPDMMGFIFYAPSSRYAGDLSPQVVQDLPGNIRKVAVFVNETAGQVLDIVERYNITTLQLHGDESPEYCSKLRAQGCRIIKAVGVENREDMDRCRVYESCCDMLLFDTKSDRRGGTGHTFDWVLLDDYRGHLPFLLSGGISVADVERLRQIRHPRFAGIDLNSRFETAPGIKDSALLERFLHRLI